MVWIVKTNDKTSSDGTIIYRDTLTSSSFVGPNDKEQIEREQKRKQKAIDRLAWEAERQQRYQKGGKWK